jgi:hypothetical protein
MADEPKKKLSFDPTINLGHILTTIAMAVAVMTSYSLLDKRVGVLEEKAAAGYASRIEQRQDEKQSLNELKSDVKELQRTVNDLRAAFSAPPKR